MQAPKIPSMFGMRQKKPNQFYFEPRYYSDRKEKMDKRYQRIAKAVDESKTAERSSAEDFKSELRENWGNSYSRGKAGNQVNKRVILYVLALCALAYYMLYR